MKLKTVINESIGWYGTFAIILAFALISFEILSPSNIIYQILNGTGAVGIIYISLLKNNYQPAVLNVLWLVIAAIGLFNILR